MTDPRIMREFMTPEREVQAKVYAKVILRDYGRGKARQRVHEITAGAADLSPGNKAFYGRVREHVEDALAGGEDP